MEKRYDNFEYIFLERLRELMKYKKMTKVNKRSGREKEKSITQEDLAEVLNLAPSTVSGWFHGQKVTLENAICICNYFGCSLGYLFGDFDPTTPEIKEVSDYTGLTEPAVKTLHKWTGEKDALESYFRSKSVSSDVGDDVEMYFDISDAIKVLNYLLSNNPIQLLRAIGDYMEIVGGIETDGFLSNKSTNKKLDFSDFSELDVSFFKEKGIISTLAYTDLSKEMVLTASMRIIQKAIEEMAKKKEN